MAENEQEDSTPTGRFIRRVCRDDLVTVLDKNATIVIDSFTLSGWMSQSFTCRFPGQVIDAGPLAPVGHGFGMGIGAQLARPGQQVVVIMGDGGLGIGGWDMETAARYKLPIVCRAVEQQLVGSELRVDAGAQGSHRSVQHACRTFATTRFSPRWAAMASMSTNPDEIIPALERAFKSGKPALINVIGDKTVGHPKIRRQLPGRPAEHQFEARREKHRGALAWRAERL